MTRSEREAFLSEPRVAVLSVAGTGGRPPHSTPTFYAYEPGGDVTFFTNTEGRSARKVALIEDAGAVTLNVQQPEFPYRYVSVECRIVATGRPDADEVRAIASRYLPPAAADDMARAETTDPQSRIVLYAARPDRWLTATFA
ncbi:MAG TPA: pyridoxamine 5'-phosphate oxidase family protein [Miltoncostaeaceae bacterium]|nr:pyridoxamine 5'-phosphate oxidase family protein [Miltoncostaeaceae bacterium]